MQKHQFHGSDADKTAKKGMSPYDEFIITTGTGAGNKYEYRGATAGWVQTHNASGAAHVSDGALASGPIYTDATYNYFGEAVPGSALTAAVWRVSRMTISTSQVEWADGNGNFDNVYTSLAVVAALSFS